jgi:predicted transposase YbfD/YdcC
MAVTKGRAKRLTRWVGSLEWAPVEDGRKARGKRHGHEALLNLLVAAFACGARSLRQVEEVGEDLERVGRKRLGLKSAASDTCLDGMVRRQTASGLDQVLERQVKDWLARKIISNDLFEGGVAAIDGKCVWTGNFAAHPNCQRHSRDDGSPYWMLFAQRAALVSSSAKPVLAQNFIENKEQETSEFADFFLELNARFGKSFEMVTSDAGAASRKNAKVVHESNKGYLFALKENQPNLLALARSRLSSKETPWDSELKPEARTEERYQGDVIIRELFRARVEENEPDVDWPGARQLYRVRQTRVKRDAQGNVLERKIEDRFFVSNRVLGAEKALRLVRLHWGVENNAFWTLDVAMGEDSSSPCQRGEALTTVSWLRLLGYNIASLFRSKQPSRHGEKISWRRAFELLKKALEKGAEYLDAMEQATAQLA